MAMTMNGEVQLAAPQQTVWEALNDPAILKACIPGCEQLDKTSDTEFQAIATVKIGPVKAKFKGKVTSVRYRSAERLQDFRPRRRRRRGLRQGRRHGQAHAQGRRHAARI